MRDRSDEKSACGVGFIVSRTGRYDHENLRQGLSALKRMEHRGATAIDLKTGDGAGIMLDIPYELIGCIPGTVAVATLFISSPNTSVQAQLLRVFETTFQFWDMKILKYREVPTDDSVLGPIARKSVPRILHAIIQRPAHCNSDAAFDKALHVAKQMTLTKQRALPDIPRCFFFTSLSATTIVYKALSTSELLEKFYPDLKNESFRSRFALFHRRFSTNTESSWDRAQPFRLIAHNGEINTIAGNRSWAYSCEKSIGLPSNELITRDGISDSGSVNEMVEALIYRSSLPQVEDCLALMMPPADLNNSFYKFWGRTMEPWDGPALMTFSNGETIGARLDRNGFRPCRWVYTAEHFYLASEAGAFDIDENQILQKGALRAGRGLKVDLLTGEIVFRDPCQSRVNIGVHLDPRLIPLGYRTPSQASATTARDTFLFQLTQEEQTKILRPMIRDGKESIGSMGDTARSAILSHEYRPFFDYFYQNFAQVTNPPFDYLREKMVTDLTVYLGRRPNLFAKKELVPPQLAFELPSPVLSLGQIEILEKEHPQIQTAWFDITFDRHLGARDFQVQMESLAHGVVASVKKGASVVILSDRKASWNRLPLPVLLILRSTIRALNVAGLRLNVSLVIDSAQVRTTHELSATIAFGATAVCPRLALELARRDDSNELASLSAEAKEKNLIRALEGGLLKIMSKMGISVVRSYQGAKLFTIIGLSKKLVHTYFKDVPSLIGGLELEDVVKEQLIQTTQSELAMEKQELPHTFQLRENPTGKSGEKHSMTSSLSRAIHKLVKETDIPLHDTELFDEYLKREIEDSPVNVRHLLALKSAAVSTSLHDVQSREEILRKFGSGAMSFGAISAEAQRDIILAMKDIGGRSNSGEGGENPYYYTEGISASTKQIASARFGVTAQYLVSSDEFQIKMAQGAKPGEGGQLMAAKVNEDIARARHSMPNVDLISPPPMHDIYSIEDLKQLIYELKQLKSDAKVGVKIVSGANIGTIAVGVAKAGADIIQVSGSDGGTGAAPISSMKHAGLPFEFGLSEVHKALVENGLRDQITLRVDGGLRSGKDIVMAAAMGAEEFDFGKLLLIAEGCIMARICEKNTCPAGIATHDPKFKARYKGNKEAIVKLLSFIAEDVRRTLSAIGEKSLDEIIGHAEILTANPQHIELIRDRKLDLSFALRPSLPVKKLAPRYSSTTNNSLPTHSLNQKIWKDTTDALAFNKTISLHYAITTADRAIPATLNGILATQKHRAHISCFGVPSSSESFAKESPQFDQKIQLNFSGYAGQGFGVFLVEGVELRLLGEANDSVGKTMSGGKIVIRPPLQSRIPSEQNIIIGNCGLYGATGGIAYVSGIAGDRFAVRNSGALAVVEGAGLHACEYMTNGTVVILGPTEENIGSGMTGGELFLLNSQTEKINNEFLSGSPLTDEPAARLHAILTDYARETDSALANRLLTDWMTTRSQFQLFKPKSVAAQLASPVEVNTTSDANYFS